MSSYERLRASDADRDEIADRLRQAATEGRLHDTELEDRLGQTFNARTYGDLEELIADLPVAAVERRAPDAAPAPARRSRARTIALAAVAAAVALLALVTIVAAIGVGVARHTSVVRASGVQKIRLAGLPGPPPEPTGSGCVDSATGHRIPHCGAPDRTSP